MACWHCVLQFLPAIILYCISYEGLLAACCAFGALDTQSTFYSPKPNAVESRATHEDGLLANGPGEPECPCNYEQPGLPGYRKIFLRKTILA